MSWKCPQCERTLKNANQWHCCVNQDIDNLFVDKPHELMYAFDKILAYVVDLSKSASQIKTYVDKEKEEENPTQPPATPPADGSGTRDAL